MYMFYTYFRTENYKKKICVIHTLRNILHIMQMFSVFQILLFFALMQKNLYFFKHLILTILHSLFLRITSPYSLYPGIILSFNVNFIDFILKICWVYQCNWYISVFTNSLTFIIIMILFCFFFSFVSANCEF